MTTLTIEERRAKQREANHRFQAKLKADPERYEAYKQWRREYVR